MGKELKKLWDSFKKRVKYMKEYHDNVDNDFVYEQNMVYANNKIEELKQKIKDRDDVILAKDNLIKLRDEKIKRLARKIIILKKEVEEKNL